jgi:hypothetical protein
VHRSLGLSHHRIRFNRTPTPPSRFSPGSRKTTPASSNTRLIASRFGLYPRNIIRQALGGKQAADSPGAANDSTAACSLFLCSGKFKSRRNTPRDFLERCLARLERFEPAVGAFVCHDVDAARAAADRATERWRACNPLSAIDGMPVGIKDKRFGQA